MKSTQPGIESLKSFIQKKKLSKKRFGVLCHPASLTQKAEHIIDILENETKLVTLFGPQHGIFGETQDNMIEWQDFKDEKARNIYSLYGERRSPSPESLEGIDYMVIDLFDIGARYYTFIYSMAYMIEACAKKSIEVILCDRPNPLGGEMIEGPILNPEYRSFVGLYEIPVVHGMTIAELALLFSSKMNPKPKLHILKAKAWSRKMSYPETNLDWHLPSPNMPNYRAAQFFPGGCLLEATSLSEGRGTTRPFELIGAPFIDWAKIEAAYLKKCLELKLQPVKFIRQGFIPTFHKFHNKMCFGALQIPPKDKEFRALRHVSLLLWLLRKFYPNEWSWKEPPYEYEYKKLPIDILAGSPHLRECIDGQSSLKKLFQEWKDDEKSFKSLRKEFLIYD